jgi:cell division protease FtsH
VHYDLEKVTKQARAMVTIYGLNDKIGNVTDSTGQSEYNFSNLILKKRKVIDMEISTLIESQYQKQLQS